MIILPWQLWLFPTTKIQNFTFRTITVLFVLLRKHPQTTNKTNTYEMFKVPLFINMGMVPFSKICRLPWSSGPTVDLLITSLSLLLSRLHTPPHRQLMYIQ